MNCVLSYYFIVYPIVIFVVLSVGMIIYHIKFKDKWFLNISINANQTLYRYFNMKRYSYNMINRHAFFRQDVYIKESVIKSLSNTFNTNIKFIVRLYSNIYVIITQNTFSPSFVAIDKPLAIYITIYNNTYRSLNSYFKSNIKFGNKLQIISCKHILIIRIIQSIVKHNIFDTP